MCCCLPGAGPSRQHAEQGASHTHPQGNHQYVDHGIHAGLQPGDIITEANGTKIESSDDLVRLVGDLYDGAELKLTVYRQGETVELTVIVGEKIQSALGSEDDQAQVQQQSSQRQFSFPGFFNFGY